MKENTKILPKDMTDSMKPIVNEWNFPVGISIPKHVMDEILSTMRHARTFITSRQKMNPTGIELYDELIKNLQEFYGGGK